MRHSRHLHLNDKHTQLFHFVFWLFLAIVLSVLFRLKDSDYPSGIFKLFLNKVMVTNSTTINKPNNHISTQTIEDKKTTVYGVGNPCHGLGQA
jgi:hypothetical protein